MGFSGRKKPVNEQTNREPETEPTDAEKFQDAMRSILAAPKKEVMQALEAEKAKRADKKTKRET